MYGVSFFYFPKNADGDDIYFLIKFNYDIAKIDNKLSCLVELALVTGIVMGKCRMVFPI